jgi:hypothetical protein
VLRRNRPTLAPWSRALDLLSYRPLGRVHGGTGLPAARSRPYFAAHSAAACSVLCTRWHVQTEPPPKRAMPWNVFAAWCLVLVRSRPRRFLRAVRGLEARSGPKPKLNRIPIGCSVDVRMATSRTYVDAERDHTDHPGRLSE